MANMKEANKHLIALTQEKEELCDKILENNPNQKFYLSTD
jgi:hypothetical protein